MISNSFRSLGGRALGAAALSLLVTAAQAQVSESAVSPSIGQINLVSYGGSTSSFAGFIGGVELNSFVGATRFYAAGYTGTRSTIANISGGLAYTGHEMTSKISQVFSGVGALTGTSAITEHETECSSMAAGYSSANPYNSSSNSTSYSSGIAYGANLWSGNVATAINQSNGSFNITNGSIFSAYYGALIGGVNGTTSTANIVTSSWGSTSTSAAGQRNLSAGLDTTSLAIDSIVSASHKLIVFAAGNNGVASGGTILNTPGSPAGGNNALVVGAAGPNTANASTSYNSRASFSAYGPSAALVATTPTGGTVINESIAQRARVDILAPGQGIIGASASGPGYYSGGDGTSFATPIVAGGAGLIEDAGQALGYTNATDNRVVTAILQNSATQLTGWTNNATTGIDGVSRTTQALDFQQGAGEMNLNKAYDQLTGGTHDVVGTGGGAVLAKGWDYGELNLGGSNDYTMNLLGGSNFESTLRFDSGATFGSLNADGTASNLSYGYLSNFSIQLLSGVGVTATLLAESNAQYITSELFNYAIGTSGLYTLRVNYLGDIYNLSGHGAVGYGLAWYGTAYQPTPEPSALAAVGLGAVALLRRRKRA